MRAKHQPFNMQTHGHVGMLVFLETHRRVLGGKFGRIPEPLSIDSFAAGGYCLDAHEIMPAGSTEFYSLGPSDDDWIAAPTTATREHGA